MPGPSGNCSLKRAAQGGTGRQEILAQKPAQVFLEPGPVVAFMYTNISPPHAHQEGKGRQRSLTRTPGGFQAWSGVKLEPESETEGGKPCLPLCHPLMTFPWPHAIHV